MNLRPVILRVRTLVLLLAMDVVFFCGANPTNSSSLTVIIGCVLLAATAYSLLLRLARVLTAFVPMAERSQRRLTLFVTLLLMFLVLMQSIGQLSVRDVFIVVPLLALCYAYMSYISGRQKDVPAIRS